MIDIHINKILLLLVINPLYFFPNPASAQTLAAGDLAELSLEQLSEIEIVSVSKQAGNVLDAPAAVFVITRDTIRRSGVTSIPEALRLAPGVEVARRSSHSWAISVRGFNNNISNKLLVLIDGRTVYSPLFAGVFWSIQDTLLEDIDRIEVISGPGGTLWGANAVNGVINIITRSASDAQGGFVEIGGGNEERGFTGFRYGGRIGRDTALRAYVKAFDRDATKDSAGRDAGDSWRVAQGGFRLDWEPLGTDQVTLQGDIYTGEENDIFASDFTLGSLPGDDFRDNTEIAGGNLLGRWTRQYNSRSNLSWQIYYDYTYRHFPATIREERDTLDIDFQRSFVWDKRHDIIWGAGFRLTKDEIDSSQSTAFEPDSRTDQTFSAFVQNKITLSDEKLFLTLGSKLEHNDYSGFEFQPNIRLAWLPDSRQAVWAAISRAVRIPSRLDANSRITRVVDASDAEFPVYATVSGNPDFESENLLAYETGYRAQIRDNLSFELALFHHDYDKLQSIEQQAPIVVTEPSATYTIFPNTFGNEVEGESSGGTIVTSWQPMTDWRLQFQYAHTRMRLQRTGGSGEDTAPYFEGNSPENQFSIHSFVDLPYNLSLYSGVRYVDDLPRQQVPSYTALDVSLRWTPLKNISASITGNNVTNGGHPEFEDLNQIERSIYGRITWRF